MMNLPSYFNQNPYSKVSALMASIKMKTAQGRIILDALFASGMQGLIAEEIEIRTKMSGDSIRPRLLGMEKKGVIGRSSETRLTSTGRPAQIWFIIQPTDADAGGESQAATH